MIHTWRAGAITWFGLDTRMDPLLLQSLLKNGGSWSFYLLKILLKWSWRQKLWCIFPNNSENVECSSVRCVRGQKRRILISWGGFKWNLFMFFMCTYLCWCFNSRTSICGCINHVCQLICPKYNTCNAFVIIVLQCH